MSYDRMEGCEQICYSIAAQRFIDSMTAAEPGRHTRPPHGEGVLVETGQIPPDA